MLSTLTVLTRLASPTTDFYPDWSLDGSKIAFISQGDGNPEVYLANADGSNQTNLAFVHGGDCGGAFGFIRSSL